MGRRGIFGRPEPIEEERIEVMQKAVDDILSAKDDISFTSLLDEWTKQLAIAFQARSAELKLAREGDTKNLHSNEPRTMTLIHNKWSYFHAGV